MKRERGISKLSNDPADKVCAAMNYGTNVGSAAYLQSPDYFDTCRRWWNELNPAQRETVLIVIDAYSHVRRDAAEKIAAKLPSAPKCPTTG